MKLKSINRRKFFQRSTALSIPFIAGFHKSLASTAASAHATAPPQQQINFQYDAELYTPQQYTELLHTITLQNKNTEDFYGVGGSVTQLEQEFARITGKEKAIFLPSGTMANQLAIKILSGHNTKVFLQETSHVFRDEADASQSIHSKRLIPLAKGNANFTLDQLKESITYHDKNEVFKSGIGVISIENPVRRADGQLFSIEEIKKIAAYCQENKYKLHLDGARLHLAAAYSGISVKEYASHFNTVYISLYKYLGSAGGAILSGDAQVIEQIPHLIKVYGGNTFQAWPYAAMALEKLKTINDTLKQARTAGEQLMALLNKSTELKLEAIENGTNVFNLTVKTPIDYKTFRTLLREQGISINGAGADGIIKFLINETILKKEVTTICTSLIEAVHKSKIK